MNEMAVVGNLTADPEQRTANGTKVLNFSIAENKRQRQDDGTYKDVDTTFYRIEIWGSLGEYYFAKLAKGMRVKIIGDFTARDFQRRDGSTGTSLDIKAWGVRIMAKPKGDSAPRQTPPPASPGAYGVPQSNAGGWNPPSNDPWTTPSTQQQEPPIDPWSASANSNGGWN